ncbi:MAG TPA: POTRA domain-containing protein [Kofleriaceae bacterium]|nr:POTRA domain-containing protein [Kofleriaceae bacterium]
MVPAVRSFVIFTAVVIAAGWVGIRYLPETAQARAEVVRPAPPREVQSISFDGRGLSVSTLREALSTQTGEVVDTAKLAHDREAMTEALAARGFLAAQVSPAQVVYTDRGAYVVFAVTQGPLFRVRSVTVTGASQLDAGVVTLGAGEIALADRITRAQEALADRLAARGKRSDVRVNVSMDLAQSVVDIELVASR